MLHPGLFESDCLKDQELQEHRRKPVIYRLHLGVMHAEVGNVGIECDGDDIQGGAGGGDHE